jgi:hypothetical protein
VEAAIAKALDGTSDGDRMVTKRCADGEASNVVNTVGRGP